MGFALITLIIIGCFIAGLVILIIAGITKKPDMAKFGTIIMIGPIIGVAILGTIYYFISSNQDEKEAEVFDPIACGRYVLGVCSGDSLNPVYFVPSDSSKPTVYCYLNIKSDHTFSIENIGNLDLPKIGNWESIVPWQHRIVQFNITDKSFDQPYLYGISKQACSKGYWSIELYPDKSTWASSKQLPRQWAFFRKIY